jgi:hypothetical protein
MAREFWDVRLSMSAGDLVLPGSGNEPRNLVTDHSLLNGNLRNFSFGRLRWVWLLRDIEVASCAGCPIGFKGWRCGSVGSTSGVRQKAADLSRPPNSAALGQLRTIV